MTKRAERSKNMKAQCEHSDTGLCKTCFEYETELEACRDANTIKKKQIAEYKKTLEDICKYLEANGYNYSAIYCIAKKALEGDAKC